MKNFIAGGASGIACICRLAPSAVRSVAAVASQPLDTVKTRLQSRAVSGATYTGGWDCFVKTIRNEGVRGSLLLALIHRASPLRCTRA
jgi:hypothetical protein